MTLANFVSLPNYIHQYKTVSRGKSEPKLRLTSGLDDPPLEASGSCHQSGYPPPVAGLNGISLPVRENLDIVEAGRLAASAYALDPDFVSGMKRDAGDHAPGG